MIQLDLLSVSFDTGPRRSKSVFAVGADCISEDGKMRSNLSVTSVEERWGMDVGISLTPN
ncbi:hypothetical protein V4B17_00190 [Bartonella sp. B23]